MSPQISTRNPVGDISTRAKTTPLRSNTAVVPEWAQQVHKTRGILWVRAPYTEDVTTSSMVRLDTFMLLNVKIICTQH